MEGKPPPPEQQPAPATPPPATPSPEPPLDDDARPATLGHVKTLRNWLVVAGIWAVAASAIAIIALLETQKDDTPTGPRSATAAELEDVQDKLASRINALDSKIQDLPQTSDINKLNSRLKKVEDQASDTRADVRKLRSDLDDLSGRVDDLEQTATTPNSGDDTNTDTTETTP
jgi:septal ring factor EnvC (AmiA/AmiB activator)